VLTAASGVYQEWQTRIAYFHYRKLKARRGQSAWPAGPAAHLNSPKRVLRLAPLPWLSQPTLPSPLSPRLLPSPALHLSTPPNLFKRLPAGACAVL
jgi:hypothetical protein